MGIHSLKKKHTHNKHTAMSFLSQPIYLDIDLSKLTPRTSRRATPNLSPSPIRKTCAKANATCVNLDGFQPSNVDIKMKKNGQVTIHAIKESVTETKRNGHGSGQRKTVVTVDEQFTLPEYLVKHDLLSKVDTKFDNGQLILSYPAKPTFVRIPIVMESDDDEEEAQDDEQMDIEIVELHDVNGQAEIENVD